MDGLISVVIPVYNAEEFVSRCLESICCQTYKKLEILVIDDGSKDNTFAICNEFAKLDSRIKVIHQENSGVSAARNLGIEKATGEYISFIDADDYIKEDYFEHLLKDLVKYNVDISCCNMIEIQDGKQVFFSRPRVISERLISDIKEVYKDTIRDKEGYMSTVWAKLIKTKLAKRYRFPADIKMGEDQIYMYDLFSEKPSVYLDTYEGYYYIRNDQSVTLKKRKNYILGYLDELEMFRYKALNLPDYVGELKSAYYEQYAAALHATAHEALLRGDANEKKYCRKILKTRLKEIPMSKISKKMCFKLSLYSYFPLGYALIYNMRNGK